ncbi:MAG: urate hydroxylase PuuD [Acidobacteria bacterium]|nr:urate hydroxylase PuuD [Acidobacteriota bacterium]
MNYTLAEWLNLITRWAHVFASILWVGQTYFFTWLDGRFSEEEQQVRQNLDATGSGPEPPKVWMVHSGGFYVIEKQKLGRQVPPKLRWFKWEAAITWLSGLVLLILVYYTGGLMVEASSTTSAGRAIGIGVVVLIVGWVVYDGVWASPLGRSETTATVILYGLVVLVSYGLCQIMSGRAAYMHVGGLFGTIMAANVWMRILPAQRRMIQAVAEGRAPDERLAVQAKLRSKHNTFMVVPVVFIMVSNHFPVATYGNRYNWLILSLLIVAGWGAAAHLRRA